jgi:type II secretory pathway component PulM
MMDWLEQRDARDRLVLAIGAVLAVLIIGWNFVWKPLDTRARELEQEAAELSLLLVDLERGASLASVGGPAASGVGSGSLLSIVDQAARPLGLESKLESSRLDGPNSIYVSFSAAPFDDLNRWLKVLDAEYGLAVESVRGLSGTGTPGLVTGQILLTRT